VGSLVLPYIELRPKRSKRRKVRAFGAYRAYGAPNGTKAWAPTSIWQDRRLGYWRRRAKWRPMVWTTSGGNVVCRLGTPARLPRPHGWESPDLPKSDRWWARHNLDDLPEPVRPARGAVHWKLARHPRARAVRCAKATPSLGNPVPRVRRENPEPRSCETTSTH